MRVFFRVYLYNFFVTLFLAGDAYESYFTSLLDADLAFVDALVSWNQTEFKDSLDVVIKNFTDFKANIENDEYTTKQAESFINSCQNFKDKLSKSSQIRFRDVKDFVQTNVNLLMDASLQYINDTVTPGILGTFSKLLF